MYCDMGYRGQRRRREADIISGLLVEVRSGRGLNKDRDDDLYQVKFGPLKPMN